MKSVLGYEVRRSLTRPFVMVLLIFFFLCVVTQQIAIEKYKHEIGKITEFVKVEQQKVLRYLNYTQYGLYGYYVLLIPPPIITLFHNSTTIKEIQGFMDSGVGLKFLRPEVGSNIFKRPTGARLDLSWCLIHIGGILIIIWGFNTFRCRDYIVFLLSCHGTWRVYAALLMARLVLVAGATFVLMGLISLQNFVSGLAAGNIGGFLTSFLVFILLSSLFLVVSATIGMKKNTMHAALLLACLWVVPFFVYPEGLNVIVELRATAIKSRYKHEIDKLNILMDFERQAFQRSRRYRDWDNEIRRNEERKEVEFYWANQFKEVNRLENEMLLQLEKHVMNYQFLSIFNPITFYSELNNEISSKGFNTYLHFYRYCRNNWVRFVRYYFNKKWGENYSVVVPFIKKGENLYLSRVSLPTWFMGGLFLVLFYILVFLFISGRRFGGRARCTGGVDPRIESRDRAIFMLCRDPVRKDRYTCFFRHQRNVTCIEKIMHHVFPVFKDLKKTVGYYAGVAGANRDRVLRYLSLAGLEDSGEFMGTREQVLKIYFAVKAASENILIVIDDFFRNESRGLEKDLLLLMAHLEQEGKKFIYMGTEMYNPRIRMAGRIETGYATFPMDFGKITLR